MAEDSARAELRAQVDAAASQRPPAFNLRGLLPSLLVNVAAPVLVYRFLEGRGVAVLPALMATAVCPVVGILLGWARTRRLDVIGVISLVFIALGLATSFLSADPLFFLIKESFITGLFGLVCLASLAALPRPLMFYIGRQFVSGDNPALAARFDTFWQYALFRAAQRRITLVWGVAYVAEALVRVALALAVPIPVFLVVSPLMAMAVTVALIAWTFAYSRRTARTAVARLDAPPEGAAP
ncbi:MAG TPA: VC0807 family protein [Chloroflexota bacterium]|nr:VC0807 family protein [Chloroflexota bacterium]